MKPLHDFSCFNECPELIMGHRESYVYCGGKTIGTGMERGHNCTSYIDLAHNGLH